MLEVFLRSSASRARRRQLRRAACAVALLIVCASARAQQHRPQITPPTPPAPPARPAPFGTTTTETKPDVKATAGGTSATRSRVAAPETKKTPEPAAPTAPVAASDAVAGGDDLDSLRAQLQTTMADGERGRLQRQLVERLAATNDNNAALDELRLLLHEDRYDPPFFYNLGNTLARLGDASAATDAYRKAISQRRGHYARALNNLGVILTRQGRWEEAHDALAAALSEEHNTYAEASYNLGRLYLLRGEAGLAIRQWRQTLALEPAHADAAAALARAYAEDGDVARGLAVLDAYVARSTRTGAGVPLPVVYARRELVAASSIEAKEGNAAASSARTAGTGQSDASDNALGSLGRSTNDGRAVLASTSLRPLAVDPISYDMLQRARTARDAGRHEEAVKAYRAVLAHSGGYFPPASLELAFALLNLRRNDEAIAALTTLTSRDGARYPIAYYHLGRLYEAAGQLERAATSFARAAELYGDENPQVLVDLSRVREKAGDDAGALAALEAYGTAIARQGTTPDWLAAKLAQLRARVGAAASTHAPVVKQ